MTLLILILLGLAMLAFERLYPGAKLPSVPGFVRRALVLNALQLAAVCVAGWTLDPWLSRARPWSADGLGVFGGALVGYLTLTFVYYWWHRARHRSPFLWRWVHQLHHSPARLEIITSFYKHPIEFAANAILSGAVLYLVVGLGLEAALGATFLCGVMELVYHWNVRTPRWLGFFVQRPEMHRVHHARGAHRYNYADLPVWDLLFGTFHNPRAPTVACGFDRDKEARLGDMLGGVDVQG